VAEGPARRPAAAAALLGVWALCSLFSVATQVEPKGAGVDIDEIYWIGSAYYYHLAFVAHDWRSPDWQLLPARENPPLAKYAIGLGLALSGRQVASIDLLASFYVDFESIPGAWGSGGEHAKRAAVVARADPALRQRLHARQIELDPATRRMAVDVMIACAVLASLLVLLLGVSVSGWPTGLLASQLLLLHPVVAYAYNHAMSDAVALLFATAAAFCGLHLAHRLSRSGLDAPWTTALAALAVGALLGLAASAKMNALVVAFPLLAFVVAAAARAWRRGERGAAAVALAGGVTMALAALAAFIVVNPALYGDPIGGLATYAVEPRLAEAVQAGFISGHLTTLLQKLRATATLACLGWIGCSALAAAAALGLASRRDAVRFVSVWWLSALLAVSLWIPFPWQRYAMPLVVPSVLLAAWAVTEAPTTLAKLGRTARSRLARAR
jgi:hypothetical protein